jgi:D-alanyl-D-alanine carboxypeptidase
MTIVPSGAIENNELASTVLEPSNYVLADKTKVENLVTSQLSNPLFSTGYGISIRDVTDGSVLFESNAQNSMLPASLTKIYTAASTAITLDPDSRFVTKVKYLDNSVYLVGGADPQLGTESNPVKADLADLAKQTAEKLKEFNVFEVNVFIDDKHQSIQVLPQAKSLQFIYLKTTSKLMDLFLEKPHPRMHLRLQKNIQNRFHK